jgi:hypothetical protein
MLLWLIGSCINHAASGQDLGPGILHVLLIVIVQFAFHGALETVPCHLKQSCTDKLVARGAVWAGVMQGAALSGLD